MIFSRPTRSFSPARAALLTVACGLVLTGCGGRDRAAPDLAASQVTTIGVNAYLWRASLDALSFAPLVQADSNGGVIVTDWYANPGNPGERVKLTVAILDRDLRAEPLGETLQPQFGHQRVNISRILRWKKARRAASSSCACG